MKLISLTQGQYAMVDDADFSRVNALKWGATKIGGHYRASHSFNCNGRIGRIQMSRFILGLDRGKKTPYLVDHIDRNPLNNQRSNLRLCSHSENMRNRPRMNKTGLPKGVRPASRCAGFMARITVNKKLIYLGSFATPELAHEAYCKASKELHSGFGCTGV